MTLPQPFRDNEVERPADGFHGRMPEETFGAGIPESDDAVMVAGDDRFRGAIEDGIRQARPQRYARFESGRVAMFGFMRHGLCRSVGRKAALQQALT